jgi:hypothetical protein
MNHNVNVSPPDVQSNIDRENSGYADFQKMQDMAEYEYQQAQAQHMAAIQIEVGRLEMRGSRLRRAAFSAGVCQAISVLCSVYMIFGIHWMLLDWQMIDKTSYNIQSNWIQWNVGVFTETLDCILNTLIGLLLGLIFIGAGVNPASCSLIVVFKIIEQAIVGVAIIFMVMVGIFVNDNNAFSYTIKNYFYSENYPEIGIQIMYLLLLFNKYGIIFAHVFGGLHYCLLSFIITNWGVLPRNLGYAYGIAGPTYIINAFLNLIISKYNDDYAILFALPGVIVHFWSAAWLLVNTPHPAKDRNSESSKSAQVSPPSAPLPTQQFSAHGTQASPPIDHIHY